MKPDDPLYVLADVLYMKLKLDKKTRSISGGMTFPVRKTPISVSMRVVQGFFSSKKDTKTRAVALVKVKGHLHLLAISTVKLVVVMVIDMSKVKTSDMKKLSLITSAHTMDYVQAVMPGVKKVYSRGVADQWAELTNWKEDLGLGSDMDKDGIKKSSDSKVPIEAA